MFIQNISYHDAITGNHIDPGENSMLIQILDPLMEFPLPNHQFKEMHQFEFSDVDNPNDDVWEFRMSEDQSKSIANLLQHAKENEMNIIVHCVAGVCRSGAVVEVGTMLGFEDTDTYRLPNVHVKRLLMRDLDLSTPESEYEVIFEK